jgi:titin
VEIDSGASENTIGGPTGTPGTGAGNVISGNSGSSVGTGSSGLGALSSGADSSLRNSGGLGSRIFISSGALDNTVIGNLIGTDGTGNHSPRKAGMPVSNAIGVEIYAASDNTVGGTALGDENVISGNTQDGVEISNSAASGNIVEGNVLGLDEGRGTPVLNPDLTTALPIGVFIDDSPANTIGGGAANTIAGFAIGIEVSGFNASGNAILGDCIGIAQEDPPFTIGYGVYLDDVMNTTVGGTTSNTTVGGTTSGPANVIQGYSAYGVYIYGPQATQNVVAGNQIIGSNVLHKTGPLVGIAVKDSSGNTLGGSTAAAGNTIMGNDYGGIYIFGQGSGTRGNDIGQNKLDHNAYGILLYNDTIDGDYQTLHRRNQFLNNEIAPIREYSGPVTSGGGSMPATPRNGRKRVHRAASHLTRLDRPHARHKHGVGGGAPIERAGGGAVSCRQVCLNPSG